MSSWQSLIIMDILGLTQRRILEASARLFLNLRRPALNGVPILYMLVIYRTINNTIPCIVFASLIHNYDEGLLQVYDVMLVHLNNESHVCA